VLPVKSYRNIEEAIDYINARPRPLALYYFGGRTGGRQAVLRRTSSGGVTVNETVVQVACQDLPFGGVGASGMGAYHGEAGFRTFSHQRSVFLQQRLNGMRLFRPPFGRMFALAMKLLLAR
jgi:coniferyl-aldehyde dehydrogenase